MSISGGIEPGGSTNPPPAAPTLREPSAGDETSDAEREALARERHQLQRERARLRAVFHHAPDAYLLTDERGAVQEANLRAAAVLGFSDPAELVGRTLGELVHEGHRLELTLNQCGPDLLLRADPEKLRPVLLNLLSNAIKFTDPGGSIQVTCVVHGERADIAVRDSGIGIPEDKLQAVFEPFVQVRSDLARTTEGTGLGLAISRGLARGMGGDLSVQGTLGHGSTFAVSVPLANGSPA